MAGADSLERPWKDHLVKTKMTLGESHRSSWGGSTQAHTGSRSMGSEAEVAEVLPHSWAFSCEPRAEMKG